MDALWQDARLALRTLCKAPVFTAAVVVTLGLGIGANAAVFTIVNRMLLKPLPVRDPGGLYVLAIQHEGNEEPHNLSWLDYQDYREKSGAFADLAAYDINFVGLSADNRADRIAVSYVTGNYFSMLGVPPAVGRVLQPGEAAEPGRDPVVILGHAYWAKRFNRDPSIVGRRVLVNGQPFTVAGVVPEWFHGVYALAEFDGYMPLSMKPAEDYTTMVTKRDEHSLHVIGRLQPGLSRAQAQAAASVLATQLETQYPETNKTVRARVIPERLARPEANSADQTPVVAGIFLVLVGLVLLVACVNVIQGPNGFFLLRMGAVFGGALGLLGLALALVGVYGVVSYAASQRTQEIGVRMALGASRAEILRLVLGRGLVLVAAGLGVGLAGALGVSRLLSNLLFDVSSVDPITFVGVPLLLGGMALLASYIPAFRATRIDPAVALRSE